MPAMVWYKNITEKKNKNLPSILRVHVRVKQLSQWYNSLNLISWNTKSGYDLYFPFYSLLFITSFNIA